MGTWKEREQTKMSTNEVPISINAGTGGPGSGNYRSNPSTPDANRRIRILIADNHLLFRDGVRKLLSTVPDFNVVAQADNSEEVLEMTGRYEPDVVLLDLRIPDQGGLVLLQRLRSAHPDAKVILLTSEEERGEMLDAVRFGTAGIVRKSTPTEMLTKSIRKVFAGEMWLDRSTTAEVVRQFSFKEETPKRFAITARESSSLSTREREIVALVAQGYKNKEMSQKLFICEQTVKNHLHNIFVKLGVTDRLMLALYAIHNDLHLGI
jgi:DNA-binding NarL/FixJ family response regulator